MKSRGITRWVVEKVKTSGGGHPVSPWGKPAKGGKTRKTRKYSDKYIVKAVKKR